MWERRKDLNWQPPVAAVRLSAAVVPLSAAVFLTSAAVFPEREAEQSCQGSEDASISRKRQLKFGIAAD